MTDTRDIKLDELLNELYGLREENQALKLENQFLEKELKVVQTHEQALLTDNEFLKRQNTACKLRCAEYSKKVMALEDEIADLRFTHKYLTSEEAGRQFAKELLGGAP